MTHGADGLGEMLCPAISDVITVYGCNNNVVQTQFSDRIRYPTGFEHVQIMGRFAGRNVAKRAGPRTDLTHNHHCGMALGPTFTHVWTARFLAHCH